MLAVAAVSAIAGAVAGSIVTFLLQRPERAPCDLGDVPAGMDVRPNEPVTFEARRSQRSYTIDEMSADGFAPDGAPDDVYDLDLDVEQPVRNIFVIYEPEGLQWDTVTGDDPIRYAGKFVGQPGSATWHLGVREQGQWLNAPGGRMQGLSPGRHHLELVGTSPQSRGPRTITIELADGSYRSTTIAAI
jgi:hypothetical protein